MDLEKSICVQRFGTESRVFLHDRHTCVIAIRGSFMGKWVYSSHSSSVRVNTKNRGKRTKMSVGNWFMGCRFDSSKRNFGRTFVSNKLLTAVIYKHGREFGVAMGALGGRLALTHLCDSCIVALVVSSRSMLVFCLSITSHGY